MNDSADNLKDAYEDDASPTAKYEARQLFQEAYQAQLAETMNRRSSFTNARSKRTQRPKRTRFSAGFIVFSTVTDEAIEECLEAIRVDETLGNPYNDIGSYLLAKGDPYSSVRWFKPRSTLRVMSLTPSRISTSAGFTRRAKNISMPRNTMARRSNNNPASPKQQVDFTVCRRFSTSKSSIVNRK